MNASTSSLVCSWSDVCQILTKHHLNLHEPIAPKTECGTHVKVAEGQQAETKRRERIAKAEKLIATLLCDHGCVERVMALRRFESWQLMSALLIDTFELCDTVPEVVSYDCACCGYVDLLSALFFVCMSFV